MSFVTKASKICQYVNSDILDYYQRYLEEKEVATFESLIEISDITNRNIYIGDVEEDTGSAIESLIRFFNQCDNQLELAGEERVPIKLWINSNGGVLDSAFTICDAIALSKTPIYTINQGKACSAGALIFICGHKRIAFPTSYFLLHEGSIGGASRLDAHKFQTMSDFYQVQRRILKNTILMNSEISSELYEEHSKDDWWITAEEALPLGLVDEIMGGELYSSLLT